MVDTPARIVTELVQKLILLDHRPNGVLDIELELDLANTNVSEWVKSRTEVTTISRLTASSSKEKIIVHRQPGIYGLSRVDECDDGNFLIATCR
jgi:hypothetical protein